MDDLHASFETPSRCFFRKMLQKFMTRRAGIGCDAARLTRVLQEQEVVSLDPKAHANHWFVCPVERSRSHVAAGTGTGYSSKMAPSAGPTGSHDSSWPIRSVSHLVHLTCRKSKKVFTRQMAWRVCATCAINSGPDSPYFLG